MSDAKTWLAWDSVHVWHPYTQMKLVPDAIGVERGAGSYLYLSDGRKVFDAISSWWLTLHGHAHPAIASAIARQAAELEQVIFAGFAHRPAAELANRLVSIAPSGLTKVFYSDNGSTAVEVALKMCLQFWRHRGEARNTFLALEHAYHGDTFGAMSVSARSTFTAHFDEHLFSVERLPFPTPPTGDTDGAYSEAESAFLEALRIACAKPGVAGFIYEPLLLGAGGMLSWRAGVLGEAIAIAKATGVLTIADEVLTGFGRTGTMFASLQAVRSDPSRTPDLMTLSKGLTGGFLPLGVTMTTEEIFAAFLSDERSRTFFHGHSFTGSPISCAAALASLEVFDNEPVQQRIDAIVHAHQTLGPVFADGHGLAFRQIGTIAAFEPPASQGYLSSRSLHYARAALDKGLLIRPLGDVLYFLPPYSTPPDDLRAAYEILDEILHD